ncbi:hypothetical protein HK104_006924 [Borealophlyctis nickersoniae]|nr:hypothetical protein HK104_006924 [Borealophlyctis nickersoniae]
MAHRKLDVDFDEEDQFIDEDQTASGPTASSAQVEAAVDARSNEVRALLSRGDVTGAVAKALESPPAGAHVQSVKDKNTATVMEALLAAKSTDITNVVKSLPPSCVDTLMKYIYRGMELPEVYNSTVLLTWHEKTWVVVLSRSGHWMFTEK